MRKQPSYLQIFLNISTITKFEKVLNPEKAIIVAYGRLN